jgi:heterodisulfide reductase subunit C
MADTVVITSKGAAFLDKITALSGESITVCDQCGTCSGSCPMVGEMDVTPSQLMRMVQIGNDDVMKTRTMWICASCFACTVRCPRGLDVSKVAEALRQVRLRKALDRMDVRAIPKDELAELPQIALVSALRKLAG